MDPYGTSRWRRQARKTRPDSKGRTASQLDEIFGGVEKSRIEVLLPACETCPQHSRRTGALLHAS